MKQKANTTKMNKKQFNSIILYNKKSYAPGGVYALCSDWDRNPNGLKKDKKKRTERIK